MNDQTAARIYLASDRGVTETDEFRTYSTFHCGDHKPADKERFGNLILLNDDTLAPGQKMEFSVEDDSIIFLLPTVGGFICKASSDEIAWKVAVGECATLSLKKDTTFFYQNPFEGELVNLLQFRIAERIAENRTGITEFSINNQKNSLLPIGTSFTNTNAFIGKFDGRYDGSYKPSNPAATLFVTVLEGAFEIQNRLLETRDSLGLMNIDELEFEALSNDAILLLLELPITTGE